MSTAKIIMDDLEVMRKRRIHTTNYYISSGLENFDCGALLIRYTVNKNKLMEEKRLGTSKMETKISNRTWIHGCWGVVSAGG